MQRKLRVAAVMLVFSSICVHASAQVDSIDAFIKDVMQKRKIPGLQLAIVKNGKIIKSGNYGIANLQDSIPVTDKTVFSLNSITKAFTGVAILQLVEAGKLRLNDPVSKYLDDIPVSWKTATIQQLLSHTSGLPDVVNEEEAVLIADTEEASWEKVIIMPNDFKAGEKFSYNQTNYLLLGRVINKLSNMSFQEFITKEQLQKVNMPRTAQSGFGATKDIVMHSANGYRYSKGRHMNLFFSFPSSLQTAAGMSSSAKEMAQWIISLQALSLLKDKSSLDLLWKPALLNNGATEGFNKLLNGYAAGFPVIVRKDHPAIAAVGGGRSALFIYPEEGLSVIVLTNLMGGSPDAYIDQIAGMVRK